MSDVTTTPATLTGNYTVDPVHSRIGFSARHMMVSKVRGQFTEYSGSGYFDAEDPSKSHAELTIKVNSIDTHNPDRDAHLRSNDFLAMDEHPEVTFKSTKIEAAGDRLFRVTGDLTIRGVTKQVTLNLEYLGATTDPWGNQRIGFEGGTTINRKDWGVNFNATLEAGGVVVSDNINLEIDIEAIKAS
ncbi:MAG: YceI family protein [Acidimicrobiales bacterium]|jgi:polyisoprenoid-binding protein YceI